VVSTEAPEVVLWDSFVEEGARRAVEGFRKIEWPNINRDLSKVYGIVLPEGLEPCWVYPGKAVYWQEQIISRRVTNSDGRAERQEFSDGWKTTSPQPANNASVIAHNLKKGLRLRPFDQEAVEIEDSTPPEAPARPQKTYICNRHGDGKGFATWKGYVRHCEFYKEGIEHSPPAEVMESAARFPFYCFYHNKGFITAAGAQRHATVELRKPGKGSHVSVKEMQMNNENKEES
jgi:hypothetical protein